MRFSHACVAAWLTLGAAAAAPFVPASDGQVLERLPFVPADPAMRELRAMRASLTRDPNNLALAVQVARRYAELGRISGDPRYAGYAQAAIAPWWDLPAPPRDVLLLRATLRQRVHDFDAALADLSKLLGADPRNAQARLTRATVLQVQGQFEAARRECAELRSLADELVWAACACSAAGTSGELRESYDRLLSIFGRAPEVRPAVQVWVHSILAELAARASLAQAAQAHFRNALALDPADHYTLAAYADFLLDAGRPNEVLKLLGARLHTDALLLVHALALKALASPALPAAVEQLRARFEASRRRGDRLHQREEARFTLHLLADAAAALRLAQENWSVQKEVPDLRILLEAARAAKDEATLRSARDWLERTRMQDVHIERLSR